MAKHLPSATMILTYLDPDVKRAQHKHRVLLDPTVNWSRSGHRNVISNLGDVMRIYHNAAVMYCIRPTPTETQYLTIIR